LKWWVFVQSFTGSVIRPSLMPVLLLSLPNCQALPPADHYTFVHCFCFCLRPCKKQKGREAESTAKCLFIWKLYIVIILHGITILHSNMIYINCKKNPYFNHILWNVSTWTKKICYTECSLQIVLDVTFFFLQAIPRKAIEVHLLFIQY
jgi:hypothetical protein